MAELTQEQRDRIAAEVAAIRSRVLNDEPKPPPKPKAPKPPSRRGHNLKNRPPKVDRARVIKLRKDGMRPGEIAKEVECHRGTVSLILKDAGLTDSTDTGARRRQKTCKRGHDLDVHGRERTDGRGGRYCIECKRASQRVTSDTDERS